MIKGSLGDQQIARHDFREIVLMVLAVLVGLGILLLIGTGLFHFTASSIPPGNGGGAVFVVGGLSVKLLAMLMVAVVLIVAGLAVFLSRR